ncbi:hypothetical protein [Simonsiella muelleri]|nr:hypothetical protein [Simonsiella muelleri]
MNHYLKLTNVFRQPEPQNSHLKHEIQVGFCLSISKIAVKALFKAFERI